MKKTDSTVHTHSHLATSLFSGLGELPPVVYALFPFLAVACVHPPSDVGAAVVLDALVGRLPGAVSGPASGSDEAASGSAAATSGLQHSGGGALYHYMLQLQCGFAILL